MREQKESEYSYLAGVDEVGRGPIAGPLTLALFLIPKSKERAVQLLVRKLGGRDSKRMSERQRELFVRNMKKVLEEHRARVFFQSVSAKSIDRWGIPLALRSAMRSLLKKVERAGISPRSITFLLDAGIPSFPEMGYAESIIHGDEEVPLISAASIFAKVHRDALMRRYDQRYPHYGFAQHKGYGTRAHYEALERYGLTPIHRESWLRK